MFSEIKNENNNFSLESITDSKFLPEIDFDRKELLALVNKLIEKLPPQTRLILFLHYYEDLTFLEISEILNEPLNTVKSRHQRALKFLKRIIKE